MRDKLLPVTPCPDWITKDGRKACCCNCRWHARDFRHCSIDRKPDEKECICGEQKGWICLAPEFQPIGGPPLAYSGWKEHGLCEMHDFLTKRDDKKSATEPGLGDVK